MRLAKGTPVIVKRGSHREHEKFLGSVCTVSSVTLKNGQVEAVFVEECQEPFERLRWEHWAIVDCMRWCLGVRLE